MELFTVLATEGAFDWGNVVSSSTFQPLIDGIVDLVPIIIPVVVSLLVIRKGMDFLKGNIYSA